MAVARDNGEGNPEKDERREALLILGLVSPRVTFGSSETTSLITFLYYSIRNRSEEGRKVKLRLSGL